MLNDDLAQITQELTEGAAGPVVFLTVGIIKLCFTVKIMSAYPSLFVLVKENSYVSSRQGKTISLNSFGTSTSRGR